MHMHVKHGLSGFRSDVKDSAIAIFDSAFSSDFSRCKVKAPNEFSIFRLGFVQSAHMFLRNNQHVRGRLGVDVFEGEGVFIFMYFPGRHFAFNDPAKETIVHGAGVRS